MQGKRVIVTGASSGIGRAVAIAFLKEGAHVVLVGRNKTELESVARHGPGKGYPLVLDLSNEATCVQCIQKSVEMLGGIDVLINNAGVMLIGVPIEKTTLQDWERLMFVNLTAPFLLIREAIPFLRKSKGNIVNVSSVGSTFAFQGAGAYNVSKAGVDMLTKVAALELGPSGVRVNAVNPATVTTQLHIRAGMSEEMCHKYWQNSASAHPLGKIGTPEDVANLILFLSDNTKAGWVTGVCYFIDGGRTVTVPVAKELIAPKSGTPETK
jgi:meso-butanediol dehydrogenase/(S,S)-butanediol dehydrogenase/diacetyl reductase